jgi:glyoxylase-like metal-dependent hydrolase (beta-lactamase superfamily II)
MASQLVALPAVERLSPRCIRILGGNPGKFTLQGTNTYLVGTGKQRILIDTGEGRPAWGASLKATLEQENATIVSALISHWHPDHVGGIKDLLRLTPEANIFKNNPGAGQSTISDGQVFTTEGATLTAAHTPGHTTDHMAFVLAEEDVMFTGDNVLGQGTAVYEDLATYLSSLDKMRHLFKGRAYPGHGPVVEDGPAKIVEYIEHRKQREEQVINTLRPTEDAKAVPWTALQVVKVIYSDVPEELHAAARGGVLQILAKLEAERKVVQEGPDSWRLAPSSSL